MSFRSNRRLICAAFYCLATFSGVVLAQTFPNKPIRVVVPYGAGGPSDIVARVIAEEMGRKLGQPMIVDNRPGAGSMLGTELVSRSPADGYTLLLTDLPVTIVPHVLSKSVRYDPVRDLEPIGLIGGSTLAFYVSENVKARNVTEFAANAKTSKEETRIGSGGNGSLTHLLAEVYAQAGGFQMAHIPYQGIGPAIPDLLAARLDGMFINYLAIQPHLASGKVRPLGSASRSRAEELTNVPTFAEAGMPEVNVDYWLALAGPAKLPAAITNSLRAALTETLQNPAVREKFKTLAIAAATDTSGETLRRTIQADFARWGKVVRDRNIFVN